MNFIVLQHKSSPPVHIYELLVKRFSSLVGITNQRYKLVDYHCWLVTQTGYNDRFITTGSCYQPTVITAQIFTNGLEHELAVKIISPTVRNTN
jgi:hypothetical protein